MDDELILLGILAVLVVLALPILVIVLFVQLSGARGRIARLEDVSEQLIAEVRRLRDRAGTAAEPAQTPPVAPAMAEPLRPAPLAQPAVVTSERAPPVIELSPVAADPALPPVAGPDRLAGLMGWLRDNWVYAVAALSLSLAGVFFVQYGIEQGLLPPPLRVLAALAFGGALIGAGEWLRRRWGEDGPVGYLPSVFSGAGLVALFAGITAGRLMYGLYGPGLTFSGLLLVAAGAVWLGWRHGPFLTAIGLLGAALTPFLVDGGGAAPAWLLGYYLALSAVGLAVDAWRRWGWISVLALVLGHLGMFAMVASGAEEAVWAWMLVALALVTIILPQRALLPDHPGPSVLRALVQRSRRRKTAMPSFPVRLATGNMVVVVGALVLLHGGGSLGLLGFLLLTLLGLMMLLWAEGARGLRDLPGLVVLGFWAKLGLAEGMIAAFRRQALVLRAPETAAPGTVTLLVVLAAALSAAATWRSLRGGSLMAALLAVLAAPVSALLLEALWQPAEVLGPWLWALHVMALAAGAVAVALVFERADGAPGRRSAWATLSALSLIALSLFILTSAAALTLALAVLLVAAVALDRRFDLPEMTWFVQAGAALLSWRLVADPGIDWAQQAPLVPVVLSYLGVAAACLAALRLMPEGRVLPRAVLESLGLSSGALLVNVLILRQLQAELQADGSYSASLNDTHWGVVLHALPWLLLALSQLWRAGVASGLARLLRLGIAAVAGALAGAGLFAALLPLNPLFAGWAEDPLGWVRGPVLIDSLFLAYGVPGLLLILAAPRLVVLPARLRLALRLLGLGFAVVYVAEEIRRLWQGHWIGGPGVMQGELYSYTVALMLTGAVLLWQALARRSPLLRRVAMAVIALTVVKVFLWDASGLSGLVRVLSFAGLGLALAGLAWLNQWAGRTMSEPRD
ncbi:DUF2339 domain-containing protein [Gemmobacter caeruleus]|uniref:DUF2339 domain-containing protein n=1 Tax=Gemmobacter caeruleus TaxID=2595004 RepID=UPI0011EE48D0|nr:DUF2339 domain-containing protein [Gemmobacter caeruleus]